LYVRALLYENRQRAQVTRSTLISSTVKDV
jgi:hypothetical protein